MAKTVYYIRRGSSRRFAKAGEGEFKSLLRRLGYLLGKGAILKKSEIKNQLGG